MAPWRTVLLFPEGGGPHCTHMQAAGVHAVQHVPHTLEDAPHPQRPADVHPARVDHHPQRGCTAQLWYEVPHTVLHLWTRQVIVSTRTDTHRESVRPVQSSWCRPEPSFAAPAGAAKGTLPPTPPQSIEPKKPVTGVALCRRCILTEFQHSQHLPHAAQSLTCRASHALSAGPLSPSLSCCPYV